MLHHMNGVRQHFRIPTKLYTHQYIQLPLNRDLEAAFSNCFIISVPKCGVANQPLFSANNPHSKITTCHCLPPKKGGSQVTFVKGPLGRKVPSHLQATPRIVGRSRTHRLETHPPVETETDAEMERDLILRC